MRKWLFVFFVTFFCIFSAAVWAQESRVNRVLMTKLAGKGLLLLFDEYELMESKIDEGILRPDIATFFASLLEAHPRLSLIFTGSQNLEGRNVEYWRILTGKSLYRRISFLSERDALCLYYRASGGQGKYEYRFSADLFRLWIRQAHSVWQQVT